MIVRNLKLFVSKLQFPALFPPFSIFDPQCLGLENLKMSGNLKHVREMSGKKSCQAKVSQNCLLLVEYLCLIPFFLLTLLADLYSRTFEFVLPVGRFCLPLLFKLHSIWSVNSLENN